MKTDRKYRNQIKLFRAVAGALCLCLATVYIAFCFWKAEQPLPFSRVPALFPPKHRLDPEVDFVRFVDVGQGDCTLFCSNGQTALIDVGSDNVSYRLDSTLNSLGICELSAVMITHGHLDHVGGLTDLMEHHPVKVMIYPLLGDIEAGKTFLHTARVKVAEEDGKTFVFRKGMKITVGDFRITALFYRNDMESENDRSVILLAEYDGIRFLMMGDAGAAAEQLLLREYPALQCDVLKVGHHGSGTSTGKSLLKTCKPRFAVISCGTGNEYSHPHDETLLRLEQENVRVFRTDVNGDVTFYLNEGDMGCETERND